jgi:hypothetical protein
MRAWIILALVATLGTQTVKAQTADEIVNRYVQFIGGEKMWKKVKTIVTTGEYNYGGMAFPFTTYAQAPDLYKFIVPFNGKYYAQAFDGKRGWKIDAFKDETAPTWLSGKEATALANEADVELESPFINYKAKGHTVILEEKDSIAGRPCFRIRLTRKNQEVETCYFAMDTYELVMKSAFSRNAELKGTTLNTQFSDYRNVEGVKLPFLAVSESNGQVILSITLKEAHLNTPVDRKQFQP